MSKQALFNLALKAFLFLSPIFYFKDYRLSLARGLFFILGSFALFGIALGLEPKRRFSNTWISLFLLLAFARIFFDGSLGESQVEWFNFWLSCAGFIYVFCAVLIFYVVYCHADSPEEYIKPIVFVCMVNFVLMAAQLFNFDFMWKHTVGICGFMETPAQLGQYSAMSLPILFCISPFLALVPLATLFVSKSISPIIALFMGGIFLSWQYKKKLLVICLAGLFLALGIINFNYLKMKWSPRPAMWRKTLRVALQRPFIGHGYRSFNKAVLNPNIMDKAGSVISARAYNDYLHTSQELGFPILIVVGIFFVNLFRKFLAMKNKDRLTYCLMASVVVVLVNMAGQPLIRYASIAGTFIMLLAFLYIKLQGGENADYI